MRNEIVVSKMLTYINKILKYSSGMGYEEFSSNEMVLEACVFNISQLGEIANKVEPEFEKAHPEIPWRQIYGLRNRIVHDYEGVNLKLVWEIISTDLPDVKKQLKALL